MKLGADFRLASRSAAPISGIEEELQCLKPSLFFLAMLTYLTNHLD